jgi:opacity protein-like surface antigen
MWTDILEDEEPAKTGRKHRTLIVLSGVAGTNGAKSSGLSPLKKPAMSTSRPKTGVAQKSPEATYGLPVSLGAGVKIDLSNRWSIGVGANYSVLSRKFFGTYTQVDGEGIVEESISTDIRDVQQYIGIPVNAFFSFVKNDYLNMYAYAGGTVEKCVSDKYNVLSTSIIHTEKPHGVQLSANAGIGVEVMLGQHLGLYVDPSVRYYFDCDQPKSIRTAQPLMLGAELGLRVIL